MKFLGSNISEGPLEEMGIHSFIYVHVHIKLKMMFKDILRCVKAEPTFN